MNRESERKRLVELIGKRRQICKNANCGLCGYASFGGYPQCQDKKLADILLDNGVVVPPCKVGEKVYKVGCTNCGYLCGVTGLDCDTCPYENRQVIEGDVLAVKIVKGVRIKVRFDTFTDYFCEDEFYLTREEAEAMLKGGEGK